ncbi:hypothetical protein DPMN_031160 [Dreissena polymorpha]|uniref:Uncharacterized protein n=1 Tax=Dreissena polymorpha TaxID=45954 RepID=A0A9D4M222_DREPO|nr:hypothetical protein DPMN_031160 [Dreissena polymorpha]
MFCGFERRPHDVHGDLTATRPRPYYDYCVLKQNAVKTPDFGDHFEHEQLLASSLRPLASLRRLWCPHCDLGRRKDAIRTTVRCDGGIMR